MKFFKRILITLTTILGIFAFLFLPSSRENNVTAVAEIQSRVEVYKRIEGVKEGYVSIDGMQTDGFSLSITLDLPSNNLAYVGIKSSPSGSGLAASGTPALAIALYNSNDRCLAIEMYSGRSWNQLTATTEYFDISHTDRISLSLKKTDGVWGLYLNDTLYTGPAKGGVDGVEAGTKINPLEYIAETEFSSNGISYFEMGTWTGGGAITVNKQIVTGSFTLLDREMEEIKDVSILSAYNEIGNRLPLIDYTIQDGKFTVSTLSADVVKSLLIETAGGVQRTIEDSETLSVTDNDLFLTVKDGGMVLDNVSLKMERNGTDVTNGITVKETDNGYLLWDIASELTITVSRVGYKTQKITVPARAKTYTVALEKSAFTVQVQIYDGNTGETLDVPTEDLKVYKGETEQVSVNISKIADGYIISGFSGKTERLTLKVAAWGNYVCAENHFDEYNSTEKLIVYLQRKYTVTLTVQNALDEKITNATVTLDGTPHTQNSGVYTFVNLVGDWRLTVSADGYAQQETLLTPDNTNITVVLQSLGTGLTLPINGVADGATVTYTVNGLSSYTATVQRGGITLDASVQTGDSVTAQIDEYVMTVNTVVVGGNETLAAKKVYTVCLRFVYNNQPVSNAAVALDRINCTTNENGEISLQLVGEESVTILSVQGYNRIVNNSFTTANGTQFTVTIQEKIYKATVAVQDANGNVITDAVVYIGDKKAKKENGVFVSDGLVGEQTVTVDGTTLLGTVNETENCITLTLPNVSDNTTTQKGCSATNISTFVAMAGITIISGLRNPSIIKNKKRRKK